MSPDYSTNAPQGYMGDWRRGAPLGRPTIGDLRTSAELDAEFAAACEWLSDALTNKEKRRPDCYKVAAWEAAASAARRDKEALRALYKAAKARESSDYAPKVTLRRVRLDSQGYDPEGAYFGTGEPLFWAATPDGTYERTFRATDRADAKTQVRETIPHARFHR